MAGKLLDPSGGLPGLNRLLKNLPSPISRRSTPINADENKESAFVSSSAFIGVDPWPIDFFSSDRLKK
jgi:hypothetical protein